MSNNQVYPLISVIMPAYNAAQYIFQSVESFIAQTYPNKELIIINDGSTDNVADVLSSLLETYQGNIRYFEQDNKGVSAARNLGIEQAQGEWIAFLDSDDIWHQDKLLKQWNNINEKQWSHTDSYYFGVGYESRPKRSELSLMQQGAIFESLILENFITTSSVLINKNILLEFDGFDETLEALEDWMLWLKVSANYQISYVDEPLLDYRVHAASTSRKARKMLPLHLQVIEQAIELYRHKHSAQQVKQIKNQAQTKAYSILSYIAESANDKSFALHCALKAWQLDKLNLSLYKRLIATVINKLI